MPVENTTPNRNYPLPFKENELQDDVARLIGAITGIDLDIANILVSLALKSENGHGHVISDITGLAAALAAKQDADQKGLANGFASLGSDGKVPTSQLPAAVLGALSYQGTWNANTNVPTIPAANASNRGWYFKVGTPGSTPIGGIDDWKIGDWIVSNGTGWDKVDNTESVVSVAGLTGAIGAAALLAAIGAFSKSGGTVQGDMSVDGTLNWGHSTPIAAGTDLNDLVVPGPYHQNMNVNADADPNYPAPYAGNLMVGCNAGSSMVYQIYQTYQGHNGLFFRSKYNANWSAWEEVWHSGNDGAGSGLDADLLDGLNASLGAVANTIVARDSNGRISINGAYISYATSGSAPIALFGKIGSSDFVYPVSLAATAAALEPHLSLGNEVYSGSSTGNTNFPIGHIVATNGIANRNQTASVGMPSSGSSLYVTTGIDVPLDGIWRCRGRTGELSGGGTICGIFQRVG